MSKKTKRLPVEAKADVPEDIINLDTGVVEVPTEKTLVDQIREQRELASLDLDLVPLNSRPAFAIAKANAAEVVSALEAQYAEFVLDNAVLLLLEGKPEAVVRFAEIAREMGPTAVLDYNAVYNELAEKVAQTMPTSPKVFDTVQYLRLIGALTDLGQELNIASMPRPRFTSQAFASDEEIGPFVRDIVEATFSTELVIMALKKELHKQAVEIGFSTAVPAVVLNAGDGVDLKLNLLRNPARAMTLVVEDEVTEEAVEAALSQLAQLVSA